MKDLLDQTTELIDAAIGAPEEVQRIIKDFAQETTSDVENHLEAFQQFSERMAERISHLQRKLEEANKNSHS